MKKKKTKKLKIQTSSKIKINLNRLKNKLETNKGIISRMETILRKPYKMELQGIHERINVETEKKNEDRQHSSNIFLKFQKRKI